MLVLILHYWWYNGFGDVDDDSGLVLFDGVVGGVGDDGGGNSVGSSDGDDCSPQFMVLVVCAVSDPGLRSSSHRDVEMQI